MTKPIFKTPTDGHYFLGYYDKSPLSADNSKLLALKTKFIDHLPGKDDVAEIGYFLINDPNKSFIKITQTNAFNWQQGCMLQWFGDKKTRFIYNDRINGQFVCVIFNLQTNEKTILPLAYYALSPDSTFALCIDNERHHWCRRGYSYDGISNMEKDRNIVPGDGIFFLDISKKTLTKIINIEKIIKYQPLSSMREGVHYLEHLMISPDAKRFAFFHRWKIREGGIYTRLYTAAIDGTDIYLLNDSGRMSHFCWKNNSEIFGWGGLQNTLNRMRKYKTLTRYLIKPLMPLYRKMFSGNAITGTSQVSGLLTGDRYMILKDKSTTIRCVPLKDLDRDGHPSACPTNEDWILSDTYPDQNSIASFYLYNTTTNQKIEIDKLQSLKEYDNTPCRCDLHPKWSSDARYIAIDVFQDAARGILVYELDGMI